MRKIIFTGLVFIFIGCSEPVVPKGIMEPGKMEDIVYDLLKADEYLNNFRAKDATGSTKMKRSILYAQIFKLHNTSRKEFYTSFRYYQQHPDIQKTLFDSLYARA